MSALSTRDALAKALGEHRLCYRESRRGDSLEFDCGITVPLDSASPEAAHLAAALLDSGVVMDVEVTGPMFPLDRRFTVGERIVIPGRSGSYPDHRKDEWGYVTDITREVVARVAETLVVTLDGQEPRGINPDVVAHGDDWRYNDPALSERTS